MKELKLENINLTLSTENDGVRVKSTSHSTILINQSIDNISDLIKSNFNIVNGFYKSRVENNLIEGLELADLNEISISVVLHYLYMRNSWKNTYKTEANKDLTFNVEDFSNASTSDIIMGYYRKKHPGNWETPSSILLGLTIDELQRYYAEREKFYNK